MPSATKPWLKVIHLLVCPESLQPLQEMEEDQLRAVNEQIRLGNCRKVNGQKQETPLEEGLIRADKMRIYRIEGGIIVLLKEEGILFPG